MPVYFFALQRSQSTLRWRLPRQRPSSALSFLWYGVMAASVLTGQADAAAFRVPEDYATIQAAIDVAASGDSVLVGPGTWTSEEREVMVCSRLRTRRSVIVPTPGLTIIGIAGPEATILDGGETDTATIPVETVLVADASGDRIRLEGLTITGGGCGVASWCSTVPLELVNCHLIENGEWAIRAWDTHVSLVDCVVSRNGQSSESRVRNEAVVSVRGGELEAIRTLFSANLVSALYGAEVDRFLVDECEFVDHSERRPVFIVSCPDAEIRNSLFLRNRSRPVNHAGGAIAVFSSHTQIEFCTFAYDSVAMSHGAAIYAGSGGPTTIANNVFYRCAAEGEGLASAAWMSGRATFVRNIIVECDDPLVATGDASDSGCNVLWNSPGDLYWPAVPAALDFHVDPRLCDPDNMDFSVAADSPCLPANNPEECGEFIGRYGVSCPATGVPLVGFGTNVIGLQLLADGDTHSLPEVFSWEFGTSNPIELPAVQPGSAGTRWVFDEWDDGGPPARVITVTEPYSEFRAQFTTEYFLTTLVDSGGNVPAGGWFLDGTGRSLLAVPHPGYEFSAWLGDGPGSYTGSLNPAIITMVGPTQQRATFLPLEYPLTMTSADSGQGSVTPASGIRLRQEVVEIEATPADGHEFVNWVGDGVGSYTGIDNPATVAIHGPITQVAHFVDIFPDLTMQASSWGTVTPESGPRPLLSFVDIEGHPDDGYAFGRWVGEGNGAYSGGQNIRTIRMREALTQTAFFHPGLEMFAEPGGTITPVSGQFLAPSTEVTITATPDDKHVFAGWKGSGAGSYTGAEAVALVTMDERIVQVAHFDRIAYEVTLSLSDVDPHVHTGGPVGLGSVYLWMDCGTAGGGIKSLRADISGDLWVLGFLPAPGVLNAGSHTQLDLAMSTCAVGPTLLGEFLVGPPGEGSLCLATSSAFGELSLASCALNPIVQYAWPDNLKITGVNTAGGLPCESGLGCDDTELSVATAVTPVEQPVVYRDEWIGSFPNPFTSEITVRFSLASASPVLISVFDVRGRRVRSLLETNRPAGRHDAAWSGRDDVGRTLPAGVYFVRLEAGTIRETRKVTYLGLK